MITFLKCGLLEKCSVQYYCITPFIYVCMYLLTYLLTYVCIYLFIPLLSCVNNVKQMFPKLTYMVFINSKVI